MDLALLCRNFAGAVSETVSLALLRGDFCRSQLADHEESVLLLGRVQVLFALL